jgi:hypothetical protein
MRTDLDGLDTGPDWITVTATGQRHVQRLRRQAARYVEGVAPPKPWRFLGYVGSRIHDPTGAGGAAYGERAAGEEGIMQAWGAMASLVGTALVCGERMWTPGDSVLHPETGPKVTRCDVQVTVLHQEPTPTIRQILDTLPSDDHHFSAVIPMNLEGGTLYVGHRSSDIFGRLYDKGAQIGDDIPPCMLWRYEVEYKRAPARAMAASLWGPCTSADDRRGMILRNVESFFRERGVPVPFDLGDDNQHSVVRFATRQQDDEKTLRWLTQQVAPALLRLSQGGRTEQVAQALGLAVVDGIPTFETLESVPATQLTMFDMFGDQVDSSGA